MPDPQDYILSFDLHEVEDQIESLKRIYHEVGDEMHGVSETLVKDMDSLEETISSVSSQISTISSSLSLMMSSLKSHAFDTSTFFEDIAKHSKDIFENLEKASGLDLKDLQSGKDPGVPETARGRLADIFPDYKVKTEGLTEKRVDLIIEDILEKNPEIKDLKEFRGKFKKEVGKYGGKVVEEAGAFGKVLSSEIKNAKGASKGVMSRALPGGIVGGGIVGGLIGLMMMGTMETFRIKAEAGEMLNIFEGIGDDLFSKQGKKAREWFSDFQEKAQWQYGIGRKEIQGVVKSMVDSGFKFKEVMSGMNKRLDEVGSNVVTLSLGIDKHFNIGTGTSIGHINNLVSQYGDTLGEATRKYTKLGFAAQRSGMGVGKFIDAVMSGSSALTQYGIDMKDIASTMTKLQKHYKEMGLGRQMAGGLAGQAVAGLSRGIAGLDDPMMALLAQRAGAPSGNAVEQIQWFKEGWRRVSSGEDKGFFNKILKAMSGFITEQITGGRAEQIRAAEKLFGIDNITATALMDAKDQLAKTGKLHSGTKEQLERLGKAFETEGDQVSELRKAQRDLIAAFAQIGKGLMQILSSILGTLVMFVASMPKLIEAIGAMFDLDFDKAGLILSELKEGYLAQLFSFGQGLENVAAGGVAAGKAGIEGMETVFGEESGLSKAFDMVSSQWGPKMGQMDRDIKDLRNSDLLQANLLKTIYMDLHDMGRFFIEHGAGTKRQREKWGKNWEADRAKREKVWAYAQEKAAKGEGLPGGRFSIPGGKTKAVVKTKLPAGTITASDKAFKESQSI